jgi:hypothetical protein
MRTLSPGSRVSAESERHFTVSEVAKLWRFSDDKIRAIFRNEVGVLKLACPEKLHKRGYVSLRIPESVLKRVHERLHGKVAA